MEYLIWHVKYSTFMLIVRICDKVVLGTRFFCKRVDEIQKNTGCFKKSFTSLKVYIHLFRRHQHVFNCLNIAKYITFI
jgi:hypothetical protein